MSWPYLAPLDFGFSQTDYLLAPPHPLDHNIYQHLAPQQPLPSPAGYYGHGYHQASYQPTSGATMAVDMEFLNSLMASLQEFATMPPHPPTPTYPRMMAYPPSSSELPSSLASTAPSPPPSAPTVSPTSRVVKPLRRRRSKTPTSASRGESSTPTTPKSCSHCRTTTTPLWRRDPQSSALLCNACGLYLQQHDKLRPQQLIDADALEEEDEPPENHTGRICSHCKAHKTSVWRRSAEGKTICNACGVYKRLKGVERPIIYKQKKIKPRTRHVERAPVR